MKRFLAMILAVLSAFSCLFAGCKVRITDNAVPDAEFIYECKEDIVYTNEQLDEIDLFEGSKRQFFEKYPTPYVTEYDNGESRFLYYSETHVLAIYFDSKEERDMVYWDYFTLSVPKAQLEQVKIGDTIDDVAELDPNGFYPFMPEHSTGTHHSAHYTSDKYIFWIYYTSGYNVERIDVESVIQ